MKEKNKKKKLPWWAVVLIVMLAVVVIFLGISLGTIRYFVGDSLSFKGILAMASYGGFDLPEGFRNFVLDVDRSYPGLPDILTFEDGTPVTNQDDFMLRQQELLKLYETYMYGETPADGFETVFTLEESGTALNGTALRQQVRICVSNDHGTSEAMLLIYTPANVPNCGMFVGLNFSGNTAVWNDEAILPSVRQRDGVEPGSESGSWPVDQIIDSGYGVATMYYGDWAADSIDDYRNDLLRLFPNGNCTAYTAWTFGMMRAVDYIEQMPNVNQNAIATVGHSRLARVSLWAGANDQRIDLVTASCGGGLMRSPLLSKIDSGSTSNHWFTAEYMGYEDRDNELPVDIHFLYALNADRNLYISMGNQDLASDPAGTYDAMQLAKKVWQEIYGMEVVPDGTYADLTPGVPQFSEGVAIHVHNGGHAMTTEDWGNYILYMDTYVNK